MPIYTQRLNQLKIDLFSHVSHHYFKILTTNNMHDSHSFYDMMHESLIHQILDKVTLWIRS